MIPTLLALLLSAATAPFDLSRPTLPTVREPVRYETVDGELIDLVPRSGCRSTASRPCWSYVLHGLDADTPTVWFGEVLRERGRLVLVCNRGATMSAKEYRDWGRE